MTVSFHLCADKFRWRECGISLAGGWFVGMDDKTVVAAVCLSVIASRLADAAIQQSVIASLHSRRGNPVIDFRTAQQRESAPL
jgi:hypothetical protein